MARKVDPIKAKAKRDKIVAGVLGGVLLVASIFAVPMSLKQWKKLNGGGQTQPAAVQTTPTPGAAPGAATATDGGSGGIAGTVSAPLATGQLRAFDLFDSKDPFEQQVDVSAVSPPATGQTPGLQTVPPGSPLPGAAPPAMPAPRTPEPPPTSAVISVNGAPAELLGVGVEFPLPPAEPLFRLRSLARGRARIAIAGGAYADGAPTVALRVGKPLTLENTADGTRYELKLLWVGAGTPPPGLVPTPPTGTPTAAPATPTSTP
jgi:hypothetical protein